MADKSSRRLWAYLGPRKAGQLHSGRDRVSKEMMTRESDEAHKMCLIYSTLQGRIWLKLTGMSKRPLEIRNWNYLQKDRVLRVTEGITTENYISRQHRTKEEEHGLWR